DGIERPGPAATPRFITIFLAADAVIGKARADHLAHDSLGFAVRFGDGIEHAATFVFRGATVAPSRQRLRASRGGKLLREGDQLGIHMKADAGRRRAGQARSKPSSTLA